MGNLKNDISKTFIIRDMPILLQSLIYYKFKIPFLTSFKMCMDGFQWNPVSKIICSYYMIN